MRNTLVVAGTATAGVATGATLFGSEGDPTPEAGTGDEQERRARGEADRITLGLNGALNGGIRQSRASLVRATVEFGQFGRRMLVTNPVYLGPSSGHGHWFGYTAYTEAVEDRLVQIIPFLSSGVPLEGGNLVIEEGGTLDYSNIVAPLVGYVDSVSSPYPVGTMYAEARR